MMKKSDNLIERHKKCPVEAFLKIVGQRWSSYILVVLINNGEMRFGKLKNTIKTISSKVLVEKLRELEAHGLIQRQTISIIPAEVIYSLTELGKSLAPFLRAITEIAESWRARGLI